PPPPAAGALPGLCAMATLARLHGIQADPACLAHQLGLQSGEPAAPDTLLRAARALGLQARRTRSRVQRLALAPLPALALMRDGTVALLARADTGRALLQRFSEGQPAATVILPLAEFEREWSGELILVASRASLAGELARFDFTWFLPSLVRYRWLLGEALLASLVLQVIALASPLFFQVVMDKVLVHRAASTLNVIVLGLVVTVCFESPLSVLRAYVFSHTTSRIDVELGSRLYRHLLALPLAYFEARRVGDSVARVRELEHIRAFLTGQALTLVLDVLFSVLFLAVMLSYSVTLTLVVLATLPLYVLLSLTVIPVLRARLDEQFAHAAQNQALLVESITGVQTVKAAALEPAMARRWDEQLAAYVAAAFRTQALASGAHEAVGLVGKLSAAAVLWFGAREVMDNRLTVGMFVAFTMFSNRVTQPIIRMAQMWTDFQQTGLSVRRLGDILNTPTERPASRAAALPPLRGAITFDRVSFSYRPGAPLVLREVSLEVRAGEVLGVVGRSGSGKSTLTKLVQRLYVPDSGRVLVDGTDLALVDAAQLRRQVGVVLQENFLFHRSVRENIAITDPAAPLEAVIHAARLAGAHDFITELPQGYDTPLGEQGTGLSGGQRQRVAIARALFSNPRILILDEATSALDYESEAIVQRNMASICKGRTVIIIAHRLSAVRHAHRIVSMEAGRVAEAGTHEELLAAGGLYARLWSMQVGSACGASQEPT
ncbi:MAG: type I secretion system permease/ATPase, partial [Rubrivivax sp.]